MDKKAQNITISTIIIIVLALIVLVVLVLGFTGGWSNLWGRISGFFGGGNNVDSVVQACQVACATQARNDYCARKRPVRFGIETKKDGDYNCRALEGAEFGLEACESFADCKEITPGTIAEKEDKTQENPPLPA